MDLTAETLVRKRYYVGAVQVTEENMITVANWCGGRVNTTPDPNHQRYIRMKRTPNRNGRLRAFAGDWVVNMGDSFRSYTDEAIWKFFERPEGSPEVKDRGEPRTAPTKHANITPRFFGDAEYDAEKDALVWQRASVVLPAKEVAKKVNVTLQEEQVRIKWETLVRALIADGPGVFETYSLDYYLDGVKIGKDLPEGHDCFEKNCTVEETPDFFYPGKRMFKIFHKKLTEISEETPPEQSWHFAGTEPAHTTDQCPYIGCGGQ